MKKFWDWMKDKQHPFMSINDKGEKNEFEKQALIGYMMEYLFEEQRHIYNTLILEVVQLFKGLSIEEVYNWLKNSIEQIQD
jgi:hypothetical protein